ncbi:MAG: hemerythrin domain-containing protein [Cytophagales bacterium]|nr:hemerythrin domain-containing protein [Cytophagales bacterium]
MEIIHRKIEDLVGENLIFASVLYYFGIKFYDYSEKTLKQVCDEKQLDIQKVIKSLESVRKNDHQASIKLVSYPIELIIEYLKHTHYLFIKQKLPFIARLLENIDEKHFHTNNFVEDLKIVFPLFVQDFIVHIYEEEDTLFNYILHLKKALQGEITPSVIYYQMEKHSIQKYAMEHEQHDDEMQGIRKITQNYKCHNSDDLPLRVLISELENFDKELVIHANVENNVLFPKAMQLEADVKKWMADKVKFN